MRAACSVARLASRLPPRLVPNSFAASLPSTRQRYRSGRRRLGPDRIPSCSKCVRTRCDHDLLASAGRGRRIERASTLKEEHAVLDADQVEVGWTGFTPALHLGPCSFCPAPIEIDEDIICVLPS